LPALQSPDLATFDWPGSRRYHHASADDTWAPGQSPAAIETMNAPDSLPPPEPRTLSASTLARLRAVLTLHASDPRGPDGELRDALRAAADEARERTLRPEELIIALKTLLEDISNDRPQWNATEHLRFREWLVTTAIRAYYGRVD
jgi:hypothetical protein